MGMTQAEVARALGRHQPFLANIESGQRRVDLVELIEISKIIELDVAKLFSELGGERHLIHCTLRHRAGTACEFTSAEVHGGYGVEECSRRF